MLTANEPTVAQFMTHEPATADEGFRLADAQDRMYANNIRHLVIRRNGHVSGVLSSRDVALTLSIVGNRRKRVTVGDAMTRAPYVCSPTAPISEVAREMEAHRYGCAVVVDGNELLGVFTTTDALRALRQISSGASAVAARGPTLIPTVEPLARPHPEGLLRHMRRHRHRGIASFSFGHRRIG